MYSVTFLSTLLSKVGLLKKLNIDVSQEKQLHPVVRLQPLLPLHPTGPATSTAPALAKWENRFYCPQTTLLTNCHPILRILVAWET